MIELPRIKIAHLPTPVEELPHLSAYLGGPRLLVKRDDQTGLAFGGNKTRKLEYFSVLRSSGRHWNSAAMCSTRPIWKQSRLAGDLFWSRMAAPVRLGRRRMPMQ